MFKIDITPKWRERNDKIGVDCLRLSQDNSIVAAALADGTVQLRSFATGRVSYSLTHSQEGFSVTSICFNPKNPRNFVTISSDGVIKGWANKVPQNVWTISEADNELYALDIHQNGLMMATGGTDATVRLYNIEKQSVTHTLARRKFDMSTAKGHSDRIYALRFHPDNENILLSGGWDNTVQIWDLREAESVGCLPGPHICGDALDVAGDLVLTGSWRTHDQIQMFDLRTSEMVKNMRWSLAGDDKQCQIYVAQFLPGGRKFIAGGSLVNQLKAFTCDTFASVGSPLTFSSGVYTATANKSVIIAGTGDGEISMHSVSGLS